MAGADNGLVVETSGASSPPGNAGDSGGLARGSSDDRGGVGHDRGGAGVVQLRPIRLPSAPATETAVLLGMLERASADPTHDVGRMERLFALYEKAAERSARSAYLDALMRAKGELPRIIKTGSASYVDKDTKEKKEAFKYAKWEEVCPQIEPVLAKHGLVLTFVTDQADAARVSITGILSHRDGHSERATMALGCDASGGKNNAQGWGSSIQYGKRYTSFALLNLVGQDDKDTDAAPPPGDTITDEQAEQIKEALEEAGKSLPKFCAYFKIEKVSDLPTAKFQEALVAIRGKK